MEKYFRLEIKISLNWSTKLGQNETQFKKKLKKRKIIRDVKISQCYMFYKRVTSPN